MTPDLDEIRAALAAAPIANINLAVTTTADCYGMDPNDPAAPKYMKWCVYDPGEDDPPWIEALEEADACLIANAPTWLAALCTEVERLRELSAQLQVEQDAALTEVERIKEINALNGRRCLAWRACADQLAAALREHVRLTRPIQSTREALAEYERLKGGMNGRHQDL